MSGFRSEVLFQGSYAMVRVDLAQDASIKAEPGAMVGMSPNIDMSVGKSSKGLISSLKSKFLGGESFFNTKFTAEGGPGLLYLAPKSPGSIVPINVSADSGWILEKGAFLASDPEVYQDTKFQGMVKGFFGREGFFLLKVMGEGQLLLNCFGAAQTIKLGPGETFIMDNGHLVAFTDTASYKVRKAGSIFSSVVSGEGLVLEFTGPGDIIMQSRNPGDFGGWLYPFLPIPTSSGGTGGGDYEGDD